MPLPKRITSLVFLYLAVAAFCHVSGQYRFDTWTTDNGLPQNGVRQITQTPDGYLWFTTFDGLVRFDGVRFSTFNKGNTKGIINNRFTGIFGDTDGTLYATTMEDGILTTYRNGIFASLKSDEVPGHYIGQIERDASDQLRFLSEDDDRKGRSWYRLNDGKFVFIEKQPGRNEDRVVTGKNGTVWTIRQDGIGEAKNGRTNFISVDLSKTPFRPNVFESSDGTLWIGENRIHRIRDGQLRTFSESDGMPTNSIYHSFWEEADGSVWVSSGGASSTSVGLIQFAGDEVKFWGREQGLQSASIQSVFNDREGNTWLATDKGLSRRRKRIIEAFSTQHGLNHSEIYPMLRAQNGDIWLGSSKGLSIYRGGKFEPLNVKSRPNAELADTWKAGATSVQSLWEDPNGKMWVGVSGGIFLVKNGVAEVLFKGSHVFAIKGDRRGNVWAATNKGLLRFSEYKLMEEYSVRDGLPNEFMNFIFEDSKGSLWFGGFGGLSRFEGGVFTNYTKNEGLAGNYVRTVYEDAEGTLWIGTYDEGLSRFKDGQFVNYREENGLYSSGAFAIEEDAAGYFWISSNRGIYRVKRQELDDFAAGKIAKINSVGYGKADGMLSNECNGGRQPASLRDENGKFWFPTQDGVAIVDPRAETPNPLAPSVVVEEVLVARQPADFRGGLTIEPGQKDVEIRFTGISLVKSDQIKFKYKLEGHDEDWIDAGNRRTAYYSYLPPGRYNFLVQAANSDGVWSQQAAELSLELNPFFYQTKLFILLAGLAAAVLLLILWKVSVHQLEARERKLAKLVTERTAELANANKILQDLANSDGLTKIGNRRRFESFLTDEWHRAVRFKTPISLAMIDIDHFKSFNDTYGHQAGDECLQKVAEAFADTIKRPTDLVARFGGEEFAVVLGGTDAVGALTIASQAVANVNALAVEHSGSATSEFVTVSVGIATMFATLENSEADLIKAADRALYQAKENGRDQIHVSDHSNHSPVSPIVVLQEHLDAKPS